MTFAASLTDAVLVDGELRAGGTDVQERRRSGRSAGPIVDISRLEELHGVGWSHEGMAQIGALTTIAAIAGDPALQAAYPAVTRAAGALGTPQIRAVGTLGGNLAQHTRCWYYRNALVSCHRSGGSSCPARQGDNSQHVVIDRGPCVAPHPSTMAMALLVYDATITTTARTVNLAELLGDGRDPRRGDTLGRGELIVSVGLPPTSPGESATYERACGRRRAEWALVECAARLRIVDGTIASAAVAVGGVATVPLRLPSVEACLESGPASAAACAGAASIAMDLCQPLAGTGYKVQLLVATILDALAGCLAEGGTTSGP